VSAQPACQLAVLDKGDGLRRLAVVNPPAVEVSAIIAACLPVERRVEFARDFGIRVLDGKASVRIEPATRKLAKPGVMTCPAMGVMRCSTCCSRS
jgi:hypothetical protein